MLSRQQRMNIAKGRPDRSPGVLKHIRGVPAGFPRPTTSPVVIHTPSITFQAHRQGKRSPTEETERKAASPSASSMGLTIGGLVLIAIIVWALWTQPVFPKFSLLKHHRKHGKDGSEDATVADFKDGSACSTKCKECERLRKDLEKLTVRQEQPSAATEDSCWKIMEENRYHWCPRFCNGLFEVPNNIPLPSTDASGQTVMKAAAQMSKRMVTVTLDRTVSLNLFSIPIYWLTGPLAATDAINKNGVQFTSGTQVLTLPYNVDTLNLYEKLPRLEGVFVTTASIPVEKLLVEFSFDDQGFTTVALSRTNDRVVSTSTPDGLVALRLSPFTVELRRQPLTTDLAFRVTYFGAEGNPTLTERAPQFQVLYKQPNDASYTYPKDFSSYDTLQSSTEPPKFDWLSFTNWNASYKLLPRPLQFGNDVI